MKHSLTGCYQYCSKFLALLLLFLFWPQNAISSALTTPSTSIQWRAYHDCNYQPSRASYLSGSSQQLMATARRRHTKSCRIPVALFLAAKSTSERDTSPPHVPNKLEAKWELMYGKLCAFREAHGHCIVPQKWESDQELARWVGSQRGRYRNGILREERMRKLNDIGFVWDASKNNSRWEQMYDQFCAYKKIHGSCIVPRNQKEDEKLAKWVASQRYRYRVGTLDEERITKLNATGFVWNVKRGSIQGKWNLMYNQLCAFKDANGHCLVPKGSKETQELANWVDNQRRYYGAGTLSEERIKQLNAIGLLFKAKRKKQSRPKLDVKWKLMYDQICAYKEIYGNCLVPTKWKENPTLASWVSTQRYKYKYGTLSEERIMKLDSIGLVWDGCSSERWEQMYDQICAYKEIYGNCLVPTGWKENPTLAIWVMNQRSDYKVGILDEERITRLNAIGFTWYASKNHDKWKLMYDQLCAYKEVYGNCMVPAKWKENQKLAVWVSHQRTKYNSDTLDEDRITKLNAIKFEWAQERVCRGTDEKKWMLMYDQLCAYKEVHGNCMVPAQWDENKKLGNWVNTQKTMYNKGTLDEDKVTKLNAIEFEWKVRRTDGKNDAKWRMMYDQLCSFKRVHGHCLVPQRDENKKLANWVFNQRTGYRDGTLSEGRIKNLEAIGFVWNTRNLS